MPNTRFALLQNSWANSGSWKIHWTHAANLPFGNHFQTNNWFWWPTEASRQSDMQCSSKTIPIRSTHQRDKLKHQSHMCQKYLSRARSKNQSTPTSCYFLFSAKRDWTYLLRRYQTNYHLTDSKWVTNLFQTKMIPPPLWTACDFVWKFIFVIAHISGKMNTTADFLSRLEPDPKEKTVLKKTRRPKSRTYWSQYRINRHRTRRKSLQYWWWLYRRPWTRNMAKQNWRSQYHIQSTSGHNNRILLSHWTTQGTVEIAKFDKPSWILI